jgi:hypothetical protein
MKATELMHALEAEIRLNGDKPAVDQDGAEITGVGTTSVFDEDGEEFDAIALEID